LHGRVDTPVGIMLDSYIECEAEIGRLLRQDLFEFAHGIGISALLDAYATDKGA
jgi:hypothetical protein